VNYMKKVLSVVVAVAMVFSIVAMFTASPTNVPVAKAAATMTLTDTTTDAMPYYSSAPDFNVAGTESELNDVYLYKMGDTIHGYIDITPTTEWKVDLRDTDGNVIDSVSMAPGSAYFTISTGNVPKDGEYNVVAVVNGSDYASKAVYIQYNLTWQSKELSPCNNYQTINGWITRGNGQTVLVPVNVYIAYPDNTLATYYTIAPNSSGQFALSFPIDPSDPSYWGAYKVFIKDGYDPANGDKDAMIYDSLSNVPSTSLQVSTFVNPTVLYRNQSYQPLLLIVKDQDGNLVTGASIAFTDMYGNTITPLQLNEISKGVYRALLNIGNTATVNVKATKQFSSSLDPVVSPVLPINTVKEGVFNPYVDVLSSYAIPPYGTGPALGVYDKLPCTIGNAFEIQVNRWDVTDPANWHIHEATWTVNGPVTALPSTVSLKDLSIGQTVRVLVTKAGQISLSIHATAWERANKACPAWDGSDGKISFTEMSTNACCKTFDQKFDLCEVDACTVSEITVKKDNETSDFIKVNEGADLVIGLNDNAESADLSCNCNNRIIHIFMEDANGNKITDEKAFTVNTWDPNHPEKDVSEIWYNEPGVQNTNIADQPYTFGQTDPSLKIDDTCGGVVIYGFTPHYTNQGTCGNHLVIQIFATEKSYPTICGNTVVTTYPMVYMGIDDIKIMPSVTELSVTPLIGQDGQNPDIVLAGVPFTVSTGFPGFSVNSTSTTDTWSPIEWEVKLNNDTIPSSEYSVVKGTNGYEFFFDCPVTEEGNLTFTGTSYNETDHCNKRNM
jgi:hypothetical protein